MLRSTLTASVVVSATLALLGCSSSASPGPHVAADGTPLVDGFNPPGPPSNGVQIVTPAIRSFPAGGNTEYCYFSKHVLTQPITVHAGQGFQGPAGHHAVVYWTSQVVAESIRECTDVDMTTFHVVTGGGGEAGNGVVNGLPDGCSFQIPAGGQLVVNYHVLNAGDKSVDTQAAVNLFFGTPTDAPVTSYYVSGTDFTIPAHGTLTYSSSCVLKKDMQVVRTLGHMHEYGTENVIAVTPAAGGAPQIIYDKPGAQDFSFNPPYIDYPLSAPLLLHMGDTVTSTCTWNNTLDKPLMFPDEMCAAFGYVLGNDPEAGCADGAWNN